MNQVIKKKYEIMKVVFVSMKEYNKLYNMHKEAVQSDK